MLMLLACVWRREIKALKPWGYKAVIGCLLVALFCVLPRYRYDTNDRVRLIYQDKKGNPQLPPLFLCMAIWVIGSYTQDC